MKPARGVGLGLLALPLALAACGSPPPPAPPTPVVINTPPPQIAAVVPSAPVQSSLVTQCQDLFEQALGGAPVNYGSPAVASAGGTTTIRLVAQPVTPTPSLPLQYRCSYSGTRLIAAGLN